MSELLYTNREVIEDREVRIGRFLPVLEQNALEDRGSLALNTRIVEIVHL